MGKEMKFIWNIQLRISNLEKFMKGTLKNSQENIRCKKIEKIITKGLRGKNPLFRSLTTTSMRILISMLGKIYIKEVNSHMEGYLEEITTKLITIRIVCLRTKLANYRKMMLFVVMKEESVKSINSGTLGI